LKPPNDDHDGPVSWKALQLLGVPKGAQGSQSPAGALFVTVGIKCPDVASLSQGLHPVMVGNTRKIHHATN